MNARMRATRPKLRLPESPKPPTDVLQLKVPKDFHMEPMKTLIYLKALAVYPSGEKKYTVSVTFSIRFTVDGGFKVSNVREVFTGRYISHADITREGQDAMFHAAIYQLLNKQFRA